MSDDNCKQYCWETGYERTWEVLSENDDGFLEPSVADIIQKGKQKRNAQKQKLVMMRNLYIIIDCSESMASQDLKPTRLMCTVNFLQLFIKEFFDQNPISHLGLITMQNKRAEKLSELTGNARKHVKAVSRLNQSSLMGQPSLQNGIMMAQKSLEMMPSHASREILVILGSLTTCDPTEISHTIEILKRGGVRCSIIGLAAEVRICKQISLETEGVYNVILDEAHYKDLMFQHIEPPPASARLEPSLIKMGFPNHTVSQDSKKQLTMCMCHIDSADKPSKLNAGGYYCPQCGSKYCELPMECRVCGLTLVSSLHLARSYHHLIPVPTYTELDFQAAQAAICYACQKIFDESDKKIYSCPKCKQVFCFDCEILIHDILHTCPGCATNPLLFQDSNSTNN